MNLNVKYTPAKTNETKLRNQGDVYYFSFPALDAFSDHLVNAYSTRLGGFSEGFLSSMNLGFDRGDTAQTLLKNYEKFSKAIGIDHRNLVLSNQQHTIEIKVVGKADRGKGILSERFDEPVDGLITNEPDVALCLLYADCVPVYLYDPKHQVIALVHSGWKGTLGRISSEAVKRMNENFASRAEDVIVCIGPSICGECYEVSRALYEDFSREFTETEMKDIFYPGADEDHYQLNLWKAIEISLESSGVLPGNIHVTDVCTRHNPDLLFSHRYSEGKRGNCAAVLMLKG